MKTKILHIFLGTVICFSVPVFAHAQQASSEQGRTQTQITQPAGKFTYHVFLAPNKSFGYDIMRNEKIIYHQPAFSKSLIYKNEMLTKEAQANTAAALAIDKIKKGLNPELSSAELLKITGQ